MWQWEKGVGDMEYHDETRTITKYFNSSQYFLYVQTVSSLASGGPLFWLPCHFDVIIVIFDSFFVFSHDEMFQLKESLFPLVGNGI